MNMNKYLDVNPEVAEALANGKPVVALESTIISHGMPYPQNVETALNVEKIIRENGAVPATIAIIGGRLKAGLTAEEIEYFGKKGRAIHKASRRDLAVLCARGEDGATTVTTTMIIAHMAGIRFFATGGIKLNPVKRLFLIKPERVVRKALFDAEKGKAVSISGGSMKLVRAASGVLPQGLMTRLSAMLFSF